MTRHRKHDPDEEVARDAPWRAQDYDRPGESTSPPWEERTSPPWDLPGWDEAVPAQRRPRDDGAHPSGPLPRVNSGPLPRLPADTGPPTISGPLSAVPREPWAAGRGSYPAARHSGRQSGQDDAGYQRTGSGYGGGYDSGAYPVQGGSYDEPGYGERGYGEGFPARGGHSRGGGYLPDDPLGGDYATGAGYDEGYHTGGYPGERDYPEEHDYAGGASYPGTDYPADPGYPGRGYARDDDYPGDGDYADEPGYPAQGGYPAGPGGDYPDDTGYQAAGAYRDQPQAQRDGFGRAPGDDPDDHGYGDRGGWYGGVDEDQAWGDDEYDGGVLPGFSEDTDYGRARRPAGDRASRDGGGGRPPRGGPPSKRKGPMRRAAPWIALTVLAVVIAVGGAGFFYVWHNYLHPPDYSGPGTGSVTVQIKSGETATQVGQVLLDKGVVASVRAFSNAAKASGHGNSLQPGYYRLHKHMAATLAFALLLKPSSRIVLHVLITEGMRLSEIIAKLGQATGNPKGYQQAIKDVSALGLPSYAKGNPEGYLFPATYTIQPGTQPIQVLRAMVLRFNQEAQSVNLSAVAAHDQISEGDAIIVASLIQAEGKRPQDLPKIARVIYNRLNNKMPLQLDTTVLYALHSRAGDVTIPQTQSTKSRYNTYLHPGLPPGPIDSPGDAAIKAALHPAPSSDNWTYFLTVNPQTGLTKFTNNFTVFQQFQAELAHYYATHH